MGPASRRRHVRRRPDDRATMAVGAVLIAIVLAACVLTATRGVPGLGGGPAKRVTADFRGTLAARGGTPVRVGGVDVGKVAEVRLGAGGAAQVAMDIEDDDVRLTDRAGAHIRYRTLLGGNPYIDLDPGPATARATDHARIPLARTGVQVEVDEALQVLDRNGRMGLRRTIGGLEVALRPTPSLRGTVRVARSALGSLDGASRGLQGRRAGDLAGVVDRAGAAFAELSRSEGALRDLVTGAAATFREVAAHRDDVDAALREGPPTLRVAQATLERLPPTLTRVGRLSDRLTPGLGALGRALPATTTALASTEAMLDEARAALPHLVATTDSLTRLAGDGRPALAHLGPLLDEARAETVPILDKRDGGTKLKTYEAIGPFFSAANSAASNFDANGHMLRFSALPGEHSLGAVCQTYLLDPTESRKLRCQQLTGVLEQVLSGGFAPPPPSKKRAKP